MSGIDLDAVKADLADAAKTWAVGPNEVAIGEQSEILGLIDTGSALVAEVERLRAGLDEIGAVATSKSYVVEGGVRVEVAYITSVLSRLSRESSGSGSSDD